MGTLGARTSKHKKTAGQRAAAREDYKSKYELALSEFKELTEQQAATAEILRVISSTPTDTQPVFEAIVAAAHRLIAGQRAGLFLRGDSHFELIARAGEVRPDIPEPMRRVPLDREKNFPSRAILDGEIVHITDWEADDVPEFEKTVSKVFGTKSGVIVPLLRKGTGIGALAVVRATTGAFHDKEIALLRSFADQAVIAIENVRLFNETKEALERQTATSEILRVISSSPSDLQPVFAAISRHFTMLCGAEFSTVYTFDGRLVHYGGGAGFTPERERAHRARYPVAVDDPAVVSARTVFTKAVVHVQDALSDPHYDRNRAAVLGVRRIIGVPLLREGVALGAIVAGWAEPGATPKQHEDVLKTFADQAVIAIENVRLFNETKEALEQQTATAEILRVISGSPTDTQPVFDAIAKSALRIFGGMEVSVGLVEGDSVRIRAGTLSSAGRGSGTLIPINRDSCAGLAILDRAEFNIADIEAPSTPPLTRERGRLAGMRSIALVPMLREGVAIGNISIHRDRPVALDDKQFALLRTFASQAVIAIENVRLFNETTEALERQTATAEILKVISSSPRDLQPVFDTILEKAMLLCEAHLGYLGLYDGEKYEHVAQRGSSPDHAKWIARGPFVPDPRMSIARAMSECKPVQHDDLRNSAGYREGVEPVVKMVEIAGARTLLAVPMVKGERAVGCIVIYRSEVRPFTQKQIDLLSTFASQAVIAIENARLFKELESRTEALTKSVGQLTALGEVGQAISSTLELETVLKTIVSHAVKLTGLDAGAVYEYDERTEEFHLRAAQNLGEEIVEVLRTRPIRKGDGVVGRTAVTREPMQIHDTQDESYQSNLRELVIRTGRRALLAVPLMREDHIIGALTVQRNTPGPFAPEVVELLKTFATQSALAIQNARLFREIAEKGKQLEVASRHKSDFLASMSHELRTPLNAILGFNEMILDQVYGPLSPEVRSPLEEMQSSGKHLLRLINNVLDLAKIEAGRMELALSDYSVQDTVESVRSTLRPIAAEKGLELLTSVPADIPLARGDAGRISQCLLNLAGNSLKFTKVGKVEIGVQLADGRLVYRVTDTGVGIPPDKIGGLFTEFKQTDATIASEYGGTGLGLSITKKFIEMHKGRIWVESELGKGSTFLFEIPLRA